MNQTRLEMFKVWLKLSIYSIGGLVTMLLFLLVALLLG